MKLNINTLQNLSLKLDPLSFNPKELVPYMSEETINYHYNKHHQNYINKSFDLLKTSTEDNSNLLGLLKKYKTDKDDNKENFLYFNLAQVFNHHLFWLSIENKTTTEEEKDFLCKHFGSYENFCNEFINAGLERFGSGWVWLLDIDGKVKILTSVNGVIPEEVFLITTNIITVCDVWEHAYYIDYRHDRKKYLENFVYNLIKFNL